MQQIFQASHSLQTIYGPFMSCARKLGPEVSRQRKLLCHPDEIHAWRIPAPTAWSAGPTVVQYFSAYLPWNIAVKIQRSSSIAKRKIVVAFMY